MTSILRNIAQRNTNITEIIPVYTGIVPGGGPFDLSGSAYYTLNLPNVQHSGGSFFVDLSGVDSSGNLLDLSGQFISNSNSINIVNFVVNVPIAASVVPNMEFTIFFKNIPFDRFSGQPLLTIGMLSLEGIPYPYILSPPVPTIIAPGIYQNVTFKSDGTNYNVVSSGPAGWMGIYLLNSLVASLSL
jgi:hypothetical protein